MQTQFSGYAVRWSPFREDLVAVATAQHFGIVGNGRLEVAVADGGGAAPARGLDTRDGLYDAAWSELVETHVVAACGDASLKLWDTNEPQGRPLAVFAEHTHEVYGVEWNLVAKDSFLSASMDACIKLWSPERAQSLATWHEHEQCVYAAVWAPSSPTMFCSASGDGCVKLWDAGAPRAVSSFAAHQAEVLCCDWNKYNPNVLVTGSVDRSVRVWDLRSVQRPLAQLDGHAYAVRRVRCSPHSETGVLSASYDMSVIQWDTGVVGMGDPALRRWNHHTEFAVGIDYNLFVPGRLASCGWDGKLVVWQSDVH